MGKYPWSEDQEKRREARRPKPVKKSVKIKPRTKKRAAQEKEYLKLRAIYLENNPQCKAQLRFCTGIATQIHHMAGKLGELLIDTDNFLPVCALCHLQIEKSVTLAKDLGLSISRLKK